MTAVSAELAGCCAAAGRGRYGALATRGDRREHAAMTRGPEPRGTAPRQTSFRTGSIGALSSTLGYPTVSIGNALTGCGGWLPTSRALAVGCARICDGFMRVFEPTSATTLHCFRATSRLPASPMNRALLRPLSASVLNDDTQTRADHRSHRALVINGAIAKSPLRILTVTST